MKDSDGEEDTYLERNGNSQSGAQPDSDDMAEQDGYIRGQDT